MLKSQPFEVALANKQRVIIPHTVLQPFIDRNQKRVKVVARFNNRHIEFYAALIKSKTNIYSIYFSNGKQKELGIYMNDYFTLQFFEDQSKYGVELSEELEAVLLSDHEGYLIFEGLTPGKQRSIIYTIQRYKTAQSRVDKALLIIENLKRGISDPKLWLKSN